MNHYHIDGVQIDSIDLKCLLVSRGVKVAKEVYRRFSRSHRLDVSPLTCNCVIFSDGTIAQMTDMGFHLRYLSGILSWDQLKLLKYAAELTTPFALKVQDDRPALFYNGELVDYVTFPPYTDYFKQKTSSGLPFVGNTVIQGLDWVAFQCLWPCEYAAAGKGCEFCFSGDAFYSLAAKGKPLPAPVPASDVAEIVKYAVENVGCNSVQITGGSTFKGELESEHILGYLRGIAEAGVTGEVLAYITPPEDTRLIDDYFALDASRIACSLELWDESRARLVTPGKIEYTTRKRHLDSLEYIAKKYGPGKAFTNFIIGIEDFGKLAAGARYLAERGILPAASVWMPMGRPVQGSMKPPDVDYYRKVKELFAELYQKYNLEPPVSRGLNVCIERDVWNYAQG